MDSVETIADRLEIYDVLVRYCHAIDTGEFDLLDDCFTPDAEVDYTSAGGIAGRYPVIKAWLAKVLPNFVRQHLIANHEITIDGDRAQSRVYFFNPMGIPGDAGALSLFYVGGYYHDELVRTAAGWRIVARREETAWMDGRPMPAR